MASVNDLASLIMQELENYSEEVDNAMQKEIEVLSKEIVKDLKNDPVIPEKSGDYKKKFYVKKLAQGTGSKRVVIANRKYQITHLLEHGHATRNGKRSKKYEHWIHAQDKADMLPDRIKEAIEG